MLLIRSRLFVSNLLPLCFLAVAFGGDLDWDNRKLYGKSSPATPYKEERAFPNLTFTRLAELDPIPGAGGLLLAVGLKENAWVFPDREDATMADCTLFFSMDRKLQIYSLEFHPDYPATPEVFVCIKSKTWPELGAGNRIMRYRVVTEKDRPKIDPESGEIVIEWATDGHDGCDMRFGPDGMLYISSGDGQVPSDPANSGQHTGNLLGSILRIDISVKPCRVPPDNPFVGNPAVRPEVWCYGLRNPWRMAFDPSGILWVGDNGEDLREMLHRIEKGSNCGWSAFEGGRPYRPENLGGPVLTITPPAISHSHSEARSIIGGRFYRGSAHPELRGKILYGDYVTGKLWAFRWNEKNQKVEDHERIGDVPVFHTFGEDTRGELYVLGTEGEIYRITRVETRKDQQPFPRKLSETGIFRDVETYQYADGVHPFDIAIPLWRDGAEGRRFFAVPENAAIQYRAKGSWLIPDGSLAGITLSREGKKIETQIIFQDRNEFFFYTYAWDEDGIDAILVDPEGESRELTDNHTWRYMSRAECVTCHNAQTGFLNSFNWNQLGGGSTNPLEVWSRKGLVKGLPRENKSSFYREWNGRVPGDPISLENTARGYLDTNCASCHREGGLAGRADFQLRSDLDLADAGMIQASPRLNISGDPEVRIVLPGLPEKSSIIQRMRSREIGKMPLIGSDLVDEKGLALIRAWIGSLDTKKGTDRHR